MNIEIKDIIKLADNQSYVICSKTDYQGSIYFYLIDIENNENIKFVQEKQKDNKTVVIEVEDKDLLQNLLPLFYENAKHIIEELPNADS